MSFPETPTDGQEYTTKHGSLFIWDATVGGWMSKIRIPDNIVTAADRVLPALDGSRLFNLNIEPSTYVKSTLPAASLPYFGKTVYAIDEGKAYLAVANSETPAVDADVTWFLLQ